MISHLDTAEAETAVVPRDDFAVHGEELPVRFDGSWGPAQLLVTRRTDHGLRWFNSTLW